MASIQFDEEVFCKHLSKFYESWKAVSLLATPCNCILCSHHTSYHSVYCSVQYVFRSCRGVLHDDIGLLSPFLS